MKHFNFYSFIFCVLGSLLLSTSQSEANSKLSSPQLSYATIKSSEPTLMQITDKAFEAFDFKGQDTKKWLQQLKHSALLPKFYVGFDQQIKNSESLSITDNISTSSGVITIGPEDNNIDIDQDSGQVLRLRAAWELSDLVFHNKKIAVSKHGADLLKLRRVLADEIYDIYEKRYVALKQYLQFRKSNSAKASLFYLKYDLLTDRLDEITHGYFHNDFWRSHNE